MNSKWKEYMRQIILDTETTGLSPEQGHRIIEIGCVELVNRRLTGRTFQTYLQPDREVDYGAIKVHGITNDFLKDKPRFAEIVDDFKRFIQGAELIIHNAPFDVGFIENEFRLQNDDSWQSLAQHCQITDTLGMARQKHPGQRNNLDALCKRYGVDNQHRNKHGALLDAEILTEVYLLMTGGQDALSLEESETNEKVKDPSQSMQSSAYPDLTFVVIQATPDEIALHQTFLQEIEKKSGACLWRELEGTV